MRIAAAGGLGFEQELVDSLQAHPFSLIGSGYDLKKERFNVPQNVASSFSFTGEYLTHNYSQQLSIHDLFIDISGNLKTSFIMNDVALKYGKKFITVYYREGWKLAAFGPRSGSCLRCLMDYARPQPPFTLPAVPVEKAVKEIVTALDADISGTVVDLESGVRTEVPKNENCAAHGGSYRFLNGEMADIAAVSCSDHSVAITPLNDMPVDLAVYRKLLEPAVKIVKESQFFLQFKIFKFDCTLFRLGRMVVKNTKEKNTGYFIYRNYLGT
jgi:hypothetical protein